MSKATLFIPDISGFTKFVKTTEILHSKHIIEELINIIIEKGEESFKLAEVEGDAVFFYLEEELAVEKVIGVANKIFNAFHQHLLSYEHNRICSCGACSHAVDLQLKFIVHSGEISFAKFGSQKAKPYGDSVIAAHRLLKNDIDHKQYVLLSNEFLQGSDLSFDGSGSKKDESLGEIGYKYLKIDHWKSDVILNQEDLKHQAVDIEIESSANMALDSDALYQFIADFRYRHFWNHEANRIIYDDKEINQTGTEHLCVIKGKDLVFNTIKPEMDFEGLSYGEVLKNPAPLKYMETNFFLRPFSINKTELTLVIRVSLKWKLQLLMKPLIKRKIKQQADKVLIGIADAIKNNQEVLSRDFDLVATGRPVAVSA